MGEISDPVIVHMISLGEQPTRVRCSECGRIVTSIVRSKSSPHACAFCFCIFGLIPCIILPYCSNCCTQFDHFCPSCGSYIGSYF